MPGMDGTGPTGMGQLTGRGRGPCGRGLGWRRQRAPAQTDAERRQMLEEDLKNLETEKKNIEGQLKTMG